MTWVIILKLLSCSLCTASAGRGAAFPDDMLHVPVTPPADAGSTAVLDKHFPQFRNRCGSDQWKLAYQALHHDIVTGAKPPYYLTSVAVEKGLADRMAALVTQFYVAFLSGRAFTMVTHSGLPAFESVCEMPYINWTQPHPYPEEALKLVKNRLPDAPPNEEKRYVSKRYPAYGPVNSSTYYPLYFLDNDPHDPANFQLQQLVRNDLTQYPAGASHIPYVLSAGNRGQTYRMMTNPHHKQQFWSYGLTPETAFMCGFFYICSPNAAVTNSKIHLWDTLNRPNILRIGIAVRVGDRILSGQLRNPDMSAGPRLKLGMRLLRSAAWRHFKCAERLEARYRQPGQQVIWYLISDSLALRYAARTRYGSKVLTDTTTRVQHIANDRCLEQGRPGAACSNDRMLEAAMQHALGEMLTFSMADYHVYDDHSGFARLGSWLSAKFDNAYGVSGPEGCDPGRPTKPEVSAMTAAHVL